MTKRCALFSLASCPREDDYQLAGSGPEALDEFRAGSFQVGIIDLGMPGMSGDILSDKLRQFRTW